MNISSKPFGQTPDGTDVHLYTLSNDHGLEVSITNYGGAITSLKVPDRAGNVGNIVLGYDTLAEYVNNPRYLGALIGRQANRLALGKFSLNDVNYQLAQNNGSNHLHGGRKGFDKKVWAPQAKQNNDSVVLHLSYVSVDAEENYPGTLSVEVNYVVTNKNELRLEYRAISDKDTIVNLTNHSYFNLGETENILGHEITINADNFTPVSKELIPTGEIRRVEGTPMDFRKTKTIGAQINDPDEQLGFTGGYDHNFVLNSDGTSMNLSARAHESTTGRTVKVFTTQPGLQFYSGNFFDGSVTAKGGVVLNKYAGFCLETQHFPDSPNHGNFPSTVLRAGDIFNELTIFEFSVEES